MIKENKERSIPLTVPKKQQKIYVENYLKATQNSGNLFLFAADQKIEHLNSDFYGENIPRECNNPEHLFSIAQKGRIGAFATQLGLIAQYGKIYNNINYVVKLNAKTNLAPTEQSEPISRALYSVEDVVQFGSEHNLSIVGVGYTIYLGSKFETEMLREAAQIILKAHQNGLIAILWIYPRGKAVIQERHKNIIAGAAGIGAALGADFVKINPPQASNAIESAQLLKQATQAAGNTGVICSGGKKISQEDLLITVYNQIRLGKSHGCAIGRNIFQNSLEEAISLCNALALIVIDGENIETAKNVLKK
jgi:fructose-bisphosphate aldolase / 6-deoxy-5-ketofructose 1-phosphate synthase